MKDSDQIKVLAVAIDEKDYIIKKLSAELGNLEVQNADYSQVVKELSDKPKWLRILKIVLKLKEIL